MFLPGRNGSFNSGSQYLVRTDPGELQRVARDVEARLLAVEEGRNLRILTVPEVKATYHSTRGALVGALNLVMGLLVFVTALGIVGLTAFSVAERRRQIGTRRALGGTKLDIVRYFLLENWLVTTAGIVLGAALAVGLNMGIVSFSDGARLDWRILAAAAALLWVLGFAAALGPALRGSRVPPALATRNV